MTLQGIARERKTVKATYIIIGIEDDTDADVGKVQKVRKAFNATTSEP